MVAGKQLRLAVETEEERRTYISREISIEHPSVGLASLAQLEKWFPLQGERGHSSNFRIFKKQNREEGETV